MYFLIGVILLMVFCIVGYFFIKFRIRRFLHQFGFSGMSLKDIIEEARLEDQEVPKSLSSMDRIYLEQIRKDFSKLNINELKRSSEKVILDCYDAIENKDSSKLYGKIKSFVDAKIDDYKNTDISFEKIKIHNTVISNYKKENGIATIYFSSSFEYYFHMDGKSIKKQDRCRTEFIYVYDVLKADYDQKVYSIHCPNCGSPLNSLENNNCSYCGSSLLENMKKVFVCNDIVQY